MSNIVQSPPKMTDCQQEPCSATFKAGAPVVVVFGGGMSGTITGTVVAPNSRGYVEVESTQEWEDEDSKTVYPAGRKFLCHPHEVSLQSSP